MHTGSLLVAYNAEQQFVASSPWRARNRRVRPPCGSGGVAPVTGTGLRPEIQCRDRADMDQPPHLRARHTLATISAPPTIASRTSSHERAAAAVRQIDHDRRRTDRLAPTASASRSVAGPCNVTARSLEDRRQVADRSRHHRTRAPSATKRRTTWVPMKPVPPRMATSQAAPIDSARIAASTGEHCLACDSPAECACCRCARRSPPASRRNARRVGGGRSGIERRVKRSDAGASCSGRMRRCGAVSCNVAAGVVPPRCGSSRRTSPPRCVAAEMPARRPPPSTVSADR